MKEIGSEFSYLNVSDNYYFKHLISNTVNTRLFRSGRDGFKYIADNFVKGADKIILMPSYCCDSMYNPFLIYGWKVEYYSLNDNLSPNIDDLESKLKKKIVSAVLLMDFFGKVNINQSINFINAYSKKILIIEDITHKIFDIIPNNKVHFYVGSIRKWLGIIDGAFVLSYHDTCLPLPLVPFMETPFIMLRKEALDFKAHYLHTSNQDSKKNYRRLFKEAENYIDSDVNYYGISEQSKNILLNLDVKEIILYRKENYNFLHSLLKDNKNLNFLKYIEAKTDFVPFSLPILVSNRDAVQAKLAQKGIYAPLLWPLNDKMRVCKTSYYLEINMLSLPVDQRYDFGDIEYMAKIINEIV